MRSLEEREKETEVPTVGFKISLFGPHIKRKETAKRDLEGNQRSLDGTSLSLSLDRGVCACQAYDRSRSLVWAWWRPYGPPKRTEERTAWRLNPRSFSLLAGIHLGGSNRKRTETEPPSNACITSLFSLIECKPKGLWKHSIKRENRMDVIKRETNFPWILFSLSFGPFLFFFSFFWKRKERPNEYKEKMNKEVCFDLSFHLYFSFVRS